MVCAPESQSALVLDPVSAALFASLDGESTIAELSRDLAVLPAFGESAEGISRAQEQVVNLVTALSHHRLLDSPLDPGAPIKLRFPAVPPDS